MRVLLIALVAALLQTSPPAAPGSIEGVVLGAGDRPIAGAEVNAVVEPYQPRGFYKKAVSDTNGRFMVGDLPPGPYRVTVYAPGYARQEYGGTTSGHRGINTGTIVTIDSGRATRAIDVRLTGDGVLSGRITNTNGQPLVGMQVMALSKTYDATGSFVFLSDSGEGVRTNDRGEYRIAGLPPGRYNVRANTPRADFVLAPPGTPFTGSDRFMGDFAPLDRSPGRYGTIYYPGVVDSGQAGGVDVQAGSERKNVDFSLPRLGLHNIRGRIVNPLGVRMNGQATFSVVPTISEVVSPPDVSTVPLGADGSFELKDVEAGDYWVTAYVAGPPLQGALGRGYARARIVDADVAGVEITLLRDVTLSGSVRVEGERAANVTGLTSTRIEMRGGFVPGHTGPPLGQMKMLPDGTFTFAELTILEYRFVVSNLPRGLYVKEARLGDVDALTEAMQTNRFPLPPLNILLARGGDVSGRVTDFDGKPVSEQLVVIVPERVLNRPDLYKIAATDSSGRFTISGVAPGDYQAFAWRTLEPYNYFDPEFVKPFESQGTPLHVDSASSATIAVKLIP